MRPLYNSKVQRWWLKFSSLQRNILAITAMATVVAVVSVILDNMVSVSKNSPVVTISDSAPINTATKGTKTNQAAAKSKSSVAKSAQQPPAAQVQCREETIPFKVTYKKVDWLQTGVRQKYGGFDGWRSVCPGGKVYEVQPGNRTILIGTGSTHDQHDAEIAKEEAEIAKREAEEAKQREIEEQQRQLRAEAERNAKISNCIKYLQSVAPNSSAYQQCYTMY